MTSRITDRDLEKAVARLNAATGSPMEYSAPGKMPAYIGHYHISGAYGGVSLHRTCTEGGGVNDVFSCGHVTKRDLYVRIHAMLAGIEVAA